MFKLLLGIFCLMAVVCLLILIVLPMEYKHTFSMYAAPVWGIQLTLMVVYLFKGKYSNEPPS